MLTKVCIKELTTGCFKFNIYNGFSACRLSFKCYVSPTWLFLYIIKGRLCASCAVTSRICFYCASIITAGLGCFCWLYPSPIILTSFFLLVEGQCLPPGTSMSRSNFGFHAPFGVHLYYFVIWKRIPWNGPANRDS